MVGRWRDQRKRCEIVVAKGTHLESIGIPGPIHTLYVIETVFLVDKGRLCLHFEESDEVLSLEECFSLLKSCEIPLSKYLLYSHLKSLGNIILPYGCIPYNIDDPNQMNQELKNLSLTESVGLLPEFDVWIPKSGSRWSRKKPSLPSFHLFMLEEQLEKDESVDISILLQFQKFVDEHKNTNVKLAVIKSGVIDFFDLSIPTHPIQPDSPNLGITGVDTKTIDPK